MIDTNDTFMYDEVFKKNMLNVYSNEYVSSLRLDKSNRSKYIIPNAGRQELFITTPAQIAFFVGKRNAGKTAGLLMSVYPYIDKEFFRGAIYRNEKNDAAGTGGIADESKFFFKSFGTYKSSLTYMSWDFKRGGTLSFEYYSDSYKQFEKRFRGKEMAFIGIDEVTQIPFSHFTFLFSINRNSYGYPCKVRGTCNPDGDSWVYDFIRGYYPDPENKKKRKLKYLNEDGSAIPENNGKILYFFKYGDRPDECYWGETKEAVYEQGKDRMNRLYNSDPKLKKSMSHPKDLSLSFTLITGEISDNSFAMDNDGEYVSKLGMMSGENIDKDLLGLWKKSTNSEALVSYNDMDAFFYNPEKQNSDFRCITADVSGNGRGDPAVLIYWEGFNIVDIELLMLGAESLKIACDAFMNKHAISREYFCFDGTGTGSAYDEYFSDSINYVAGFSAFDKKTVIIGNKKQEVSNYENVRAQIFDEMATRIRQRGYSIDEDVLYRKLDGKMVIDHFREEYPCIAKIQNNEYKFQAMRKSDMKSKIGHSPNFVDAWSMREYVNLYFEKKTNNIKRIGAFLL